MPSILLTQEQKTTIRGQVSTYYSLTPPTSTTANVTEPNSFFAAEQLFYRIINNVFVHAHRVDETIVHNCQIQTSDAAAVSDHNGRDISDFKDMPTFKL